LRRWIEGVSRALRAVLSSSRKADEVAADAASPEEVAQASKLDELSVLLGRAKEALASDQLPLAIELFEQIVASGGFTSEGYYGIGIAARRLGREEEGVAALLAAAASNPPHPEAAFCLAELASAEGREIDARDYYQLAIDVVPTFAGAVLGLGKTEARLGHDEEAAKCYQRAFELSGYPEPGLRYGEWLLLNGDDGRARDVFAAVLKATPGVAEAEYWLGVAQLALNDVVSAREAFARALTVNPDFVSARTADDFAAIFPARRELRGPRARRALICLPAMQFRTGWLGGQIYLLNFARILSVLPKAQRPRLVVVVMDDWAERSGFRDIVEELAQCEAVIGVFDTQQNPIAAKPALRRYLAADGVAAADRRGRLFDAIDWTFPVLYPSWGMATVPRPIYWIPDFQHRFWPGYFAKEELVARDRDIKALSVRDVPIVFSSGDAQSHFAQFYPEARSHSHVWHFHTAPDDMADTPDSNQFASLGLPDRFYYTPNQFWQHKDHETLFRGLRLLLDRGCDVTFVCTGSDLRNSSDPYQQRLLALIDELDLRDHLRLVGVLPRSLQFELFRRACAIIQPSLFEGWSTVVEDARALGRPMIVSDIPLHREQIEGEAVFFAAQDPASLANAVAGIDAVLAPGPDLAREAAASAQMRRKLEESAAAFLAVLGAH